MAARAMSRGWLRLAAAGACLVVLVCALLTFALPASAQPNGLEYAVKATYLYKFIPFVEWPEVPGDVPAGPVNLCVVGDDPFGQTLERAVGERAVGEREVGERELAVLRFRTADRAAGCHVMYIASTGPQSAAAALAAVRGMPVLTVTDSARNPQSKGIINFVTRAGRVRFEIDSRAAAENGIAISSKLLSLAVTVRSGI